MKPGKVVYRSVSDDYGGKAERSERKENRR